MITWRDVLAALTFVFSAVTLWLRLSDRYKQNRRARRNRELMNADPVDPMQHTRSSDRDPDVGEGTGDDPDGAGGDRDRRD